jgi:hypothetical protein
MFDVPTLVSSILAVLSTGGWLMSHRVRKKEDEKHAVELEHARAESDALRQRTELDYTKEILELYSAHIVQPLKDQIDNTNKRLDNYEIAINQAPRCKLYPDCPVIVRLQKSGKGDGTPLHASD